MATRSKPEDMAPLNLSDRGVARWGRIPVTSTALTHILRTGIRLDPDRSLTVWRRCYLYARHRSDSINVSTGTSFAHRPCVEQAPCQDSIENGCSGSAVLSGRGASWGARM